MIYDYKCTQCKKVEQINLKMGSDLPKALPCDCGGKKVQDLASKLSGLTIHITESFKAGSPYAPKDYNKGSSPLEDIGY